MYLRALLHAFTGLVLGPLWLMALALSWGLGLGLAAGAQMGRTEAGLARRLLGAQVDGVDANSDAQVYLLARGLLAPLAFPLALVGAYGQLWAPLAERLLHTGSRHAAGVQARDVGVAAAAVGGVTTVIWAATGTGYFWPMWPVFGVAALAGLAAVHSQLAFKGLAMAVCLAVWLMTGAGYFWPIWPLLGMLVHEGGDRLMGDAVRARRRVTELTETRAEVVGAQEDELRRIERDLHDGAQARLVSLAMSLGLAESRLDEDPGRARELMAEAQDQARTALRELRDLARGIAPPVLQDRGLKAAVEALAATVPIPVTVTGSTARAPAAIERAAYFVAAEALANAVKHAGAHEIAVTVTHTALDLELEVKDDGRGGANPAGSGLAGLRRRVEAVDGRLRIESTGERGTIIHAWLPCASS